MTVLAALFTINQAIAENSEINSSSWTGQYIGFSIGASKGEADPTVHAKATTYFITTDPGQTNPQGSHDMSATNVGGNLFWGANIQADDLIYGIEAGVSLTDYDEQYNSPRISYLTAPAEDFGISTRVSSRLAISIRPRVGYVVQKSLFYISAGVTMRRFNYEFNYSDKPSNNEATSLSENKWKLGWVAGLGYEFKIQNGWSVKTEYLYSSYDNIINTQSSLTSSSYTADGFTHQLDFTEQSLNIGLSKMF